MEKRKATTNYRGKASGYYLDCSCHLSVGKAKQSNRVKAKNRQAGHKVIRAQ